MIRTELTGMLPGAIRKVEELLAATANLNPQVTRGYDSTTGKDSFFYWGAACRITCGTMATLKTKAKALGFTWLSDDGDVAFTSGLTIGDFQTFRVNGELELMPAKEAM